MPLAWLGQLTVPLSSYTLFYHCCTQYAISHSSSNSVSSVVRQNAFSETVCRQRALMAGPPRAEGELWLALWLGVGRQPKRTDALALLERVGRALRREKPPPEPDIFVLAAVAGRGATHAEASPMDWPS